MFRNTVDDLSSDFVPRYTFGEQPVQNDRELSPLTSTINSVHNSMQTLSFSENNTNARNNGFFARIWHSLRTSEGSHAQKNHRDEKGTELKDITAGGEALRREAESLRGTDTAEPVPHGWKGSLLKRSLIGAGVLTGTGVLGAAGYEYFNAGSARAGTRAGTPESSFAPSDSVNRGQGYGGSLETMSGHHAIHHNDPAGKLRHRRHLDASPYRSKEPVRKPSHLKSPVHRANHSVKKLLCSEGILQNKTTSCKEKLLSLASLYLINGSTDPVEQDNRMKLLARAILSGSGMYGGGKGEDISSEQAKCAIRNWVFVNVIGQNPEKYIERQMKADMSRRYTVEDIKGFLPVDTLPEISGFHPGRLSAAENANLSILWKRLLMEDMPFLAFIDARVIKMPLNDYEFANLYAGSRFLKSTVGENFTANDAILTGEKMWALAVTEGITEDKMKFYLSPALYFISAESREIKAKDNDFAVVNAYLQYRQEISNVQKDINDKYNSYLLATKAWLSKGNFADKIVSQCSSLRPGFTDLADSLRTLKQQRERAESVAKQDYLNGMGKPCKKAPESLSDEYHKLTANTADSFREIDKYLILSAISSLPGDERKFIQSAGKRIYPANAYIQMMEPGSFFVTHKQYLERADLFVVKQHGEERIYALKAEKNNDNGYKLIRVDRDIKQYISSGIFGKSLDDYKFTWDKVEDSRDIANFGVNMNENAWSGSGGNVNIITDSISKKHRDDLYNALYEAGNDKSDIQKVWNVIKHFIPFYDCVEGGVNNNPEQAVPACLLDAVAFVPVFGKAVSLSGKFGKGFARGLRSGAQTVGRDGIQAAGKGFLQEIQLPTTAELVSLGKDTFRAADPGFALMGGISRKFSNILVKQLSKDSKTASLAKSIASSVHLNRLSNTPPGKIQRVKLPQTEVSVPIVKIRKGGGAQIYVRVDPETGERFGQLYVKNKSGELIELSNRAGQLEYPKKIVRGLGRWKSYDHEKLAKNEIIPHRSGFYTTLDSRGKITGKLYLMRKDIGLSITEIYQDKYYLARGKGHKVILEKKAITGNFEVVDRNPDKKLSKGEYFDNTWCSSSVSGRRLLVNTGVDCVGGPDLGDETLAYRYNVLLNGHVKANDFDVKISGIYGMDTPSRLSVKEHLDDILFHENGYVHLIQDPIDATEYEKIFADKDIVVSESELVFTDQTDAGVVSKNRLSKNEKLAVRRWTAIDDEVDERFSDGMKDLDTIGMTSKNYELNQKLDLPGRLDEDERNMVRLFDSALNKIPSQRGEFIRVSEYSDSLTPWDGEIRPGDIVTNYPRYMSVSSNMDYIQQGTINEETKAYIYYKFENTYSSKPLLKGSASLVDELESVFRRDSAFRVKQIAIADDVTLGEHASEVRKRIVVTLDEVEFPADNTAKNIHSGKVVNVLM